VILKLDISSFELEVMLFELTTLKSLTPRLYRDGECRSCLSKFQRLLLDPTDEGQSQNGPGQQRSSPCSFQNELRLLYISSLNSLIGKNKLNKDADTGTKDNAVGSSTSCQALTC
jgi:hypothetical protein